MTPVVACPACGKQVAWIEASAWRPFCSERCKMIDLGDWAADRHVIPGSAAEMTEDIPPSEAPVRPQG
jgi:endogenous inhibitor of DNA gyrase (YacG/DUF329 family)